MAIDWNRHWGGLRDEMGRFAALPDELAGMDVTEACRRETESLACRGMVYQMERIVRVLRSKHVPQSLRDRHPDVPWVAIPAFVRCFGGDRVFWECGMAAKDAADAHAAELMRSFCVDTAPKVAVAAERMREECMATPGLDGNGRDGIQYVETHGDVAEVLLRLPASRMEEFRAWLAEANAGLPVLTEGIVRERLHAVSDEMRRLGVGRLMLFGSVARGEARPGSDVDMLYEADDATEGGEFARWSEIHSALEEAVRAPVDLIRYDDRFGPSVPVWESGPVEEAP